MREGTSFRTGTRVSFTHPDNRLLFGLIVDRTMNTPYGTFYNVSFDSGETIQVIDNDFSVIEKFQIGSKAWFSNTNGQHVECIVTGIAESGDGSKWYQLQLGDTTRWHRGTDVFILDRIYENGLLRTHSF